MPRRVIRLIDKFGAFDRWRRDEGRRRRGAQIASQSERFVAAFCRCTPQAAECWPIKVWLTDVRSKLGSQAVNYVRTAGNRRALRKGQPHNWHGQAVPCGQTAPWL